MIEESKPTGRSTRVTTGEARPAAKSAAGTAAAKTAAKGRAKPAVDAAAPDKAAARAPAKAPVTAAVKAKAAAAAGVSPDERARMIETAAYFRAERRGFEPGYETEDWAVAEAEIDELLSLDAGKAAPAARKKTPKSPG